MSGLVLPGDARVGVKLVRYRDLILNTPNLVAAWPLDEASGTTADDAKGSNNGTYTGGVTLGQPGQIYGHTAASFDGTDDRVEIPDADELDLAGAFTAEAWIMGSTFTGFQNVVGKIDTGAANGWEIRVFTTDAPRLASLIRNAGVFSDPGVGPSLTVGTWHHVVLWFNGASVCHYLDAVSSTPVSATTVPGIHTNGAAIGARRLTTTDRYWNGRVEWAAVYNRALTAEEIRMRYTAGLRKRKLGLA